MPSKSPAQERLMRAVAHGWKPSRIKGPSRAVAKEFVEADKKYSGGFAENRYWTGGLAAMNEINSGVPETLRFQEGGEALKPIKLTKSFNDIFKIPVYVEKGWTYNKATNTLWPPTPTVTGESEDPRVAMAALTPEIRGEPEPWMPRVIPGSAGTAESVQQTFTPASVQTPEERAAATAEARKSSYREQLREHKARVAAALNPEPEGAARGGHMKYQEGGTVPKIEMRPGLGGAIVGHAEGPNPYAKHIDTHPDLYHEWERRNHIDPPPAEGEAEAEPPVVPPEEEGSGAMDWLRSVLGVGEDTGIAGRSARELERMEAEGRGEVPAAQARGGHVQRYQGGGLARVAPPSGGVPPWVEPIEYVEPVGYQFGGAARWSPQQQAAWRSAAGNAPLRRAMTQEHQQRRALQRRAPAVAPQRANLAGIRAQLEQQAQQRAALAGRGAPAGGGLAAAMQRNLAQQTAQQRAALARPQPTGFMGRVRQMADAQRQRAALVGGQGLAAPWQGDPATNPMRPRGPLMPGGGPLRLPGRGTGPWMPRVIDQPGGGIPGGPRVPPNMRGFLQKQRMMNRPPPNVGRGVNRVGQQDQQGAQARALQRGTGRRPMSRRGGFPGRRGMR